MKKTIRIISSILMLLVMTSTLFAYMGSGQRQGKAFGKNQNGYVYTVYDDTQVNHQMQIEEFPIEDLNQDEINGLILMREEEKLARDVYLKLYDVWGTEIFSNIAKSEETHTGAIKLLLDRYNLTDPVSNDEVGVFTNEDLGNLYNDLVAQGSDSLVSALTVGATIEDLDIKDLEEQLNKTDNQDITQIYENLMRGSRNHLRSFTNLLESNNGTYLPQYISEDEYNSIISTEMERGNSNMNQSRRNNNSQQQPHIGENQGQQNSNRQNGNYNTNNNGMSQNNGQQSKQGGTNTQQKGNSAQNSNGVKSQNTFSKMWSGFLSWFN